MTKKHILIIEDDEALSSLLSSQLASAGFDTEVAADGEQGLEAAKAKPDLILLDILLPKMDGFSVMKTIRERDEWGATVPIVIASNLNADDDRAVNSVSTYSPALYLVKSEHSLEDIVQKVTDILSGSSR